ncbi:hypothetical protein E4U22_001216 [Claviceps purpurea]|nr:hypothetical protein E4U12_006992 [Claviceps purpurea]KAG6313195.1 hypothetical protein E4U22_001216 [Claviceps purpurea]
MSLDEQSPRDSLSIGTCSLRRMITSNYNANMAPIAIMAEKLMYTSEIPAHPKTSQGGTAYAVRVEHLHPEDAKEPWKAVQYQTSRYSDHPSSSAFLGNIPVHIYQYRATGAQV